MILKLYCIKKISLKKIVYILSLLLLSNSLCAGPPIELPSLLEMVVSKTKLPYGPNQRVSNTANTNIPGLALYDPAWFKISLNQYLAAVRKDGYTEKNLILFIPKDVFSKEDKLDLIHIAKKNGYTKLTISEVDDNVNTKDLTKKYISTGIEVVEQDIYEKNLLQNIKKQDLTNQIAKEYGFLDNTELMTQLHNYTFRDKLSNFWQNNTDRAVGGLKFFIAMSSRLGVYGSKIKLASKGLSIFMGGLIAKNLALETYFAFFIRSWRKLNAGIEKKAGRAGVGVFNWSFGVGQQLIDRVLAKAAGLPDALLNWQYFMDLAIQELSNSGVETIRMPGVNKLLKKGVLTESQAASVLIIPDFFYPLSQAALSVGSRELQQMVLSTMIALKLATGIWGELAPEKDIRILGTAKTLGLRDVKNRIPNVAESDFYTTKKALTQFFKNPFIPVSEKLKFVKYIKNILLNHSDIVEKYPIFKSMMLSIVEYIDNSYALIDEWKEYKKNKSNDELVKMADNYLNLTDNVLNELKKGQIDAVKLAKQDLNHLFKSLTKTEKIVTRNTRSVNELSSTLGKKLSAYTFLIRDMIWNVFLTDPKLRIMNETEIAKHYNKVDFLSKETYSSANYSAYSQDLLLMAQKAGASFMTCSKSLSTMSNF